MGSLEEAGREKDDIAELQKRVGWEIGGTTCVSGGSSSAAALWRMVWWCLARRSLMCSPIVVVDILRERESQLERDSEQRVEREREREGGERLIVAVTESKK